MSAVVHYSAAADGVIPKRLLCGRKPKDGNEWTRCSWLVECARCRERLGASPLPPSAASHASTEEK